MLVKVAGMYLTLGTFSVMDGGESGTMLYLHGAEQPIFIDPDDAANLYAILDEAIANQSTLQTQIETVNKQHAELQAKAQEIAAYEQQLMQKAAQVDAAYAAMQQQKSPVILPPGFGRKRG